MGLDPVTAEVIRNALLVAAHEAGVVVVKASHSTFIQEGADASTALLDARGRLIASSTATTLMHSASLRESLRALLVDIPLHTMRPGDVFAQNDPYKGGIHANDIAILRPVFGPDNRPHYFAGTIIHVADVGGGYAGGVAATAQDVYAEGLILPPLHLFREGEPVDVVWKILENNSRTPDKVIGDIRALVSGVNVLARRIEELMDRYGVSGDAEHPGLAEYIEDYLAYTERRMREELRAFRPGTYKGSFTIDSDGITPNRTYDVVVAVTLPGDGSIHLDFAGTSPQAKGAINASTSQAISGVLFAVRCFLDHTIPLNEGCFAPISMTFPRGTMVNPNPPAAGGGRIVTVTAAMEAIVDALSAARPELALASSGIVHLYALSGTRPPDPAIAADGAGREPWLVMALDFGGLGARSTCDGPDATGAFVLGGRGAVLQVEPYEAQYPVLIEHTRARVDSGGAGQHRGGLGIDTAIRMLEDGELVVRGDRMVLPPTGRQGGRDGEAGFWRVEHPDGQLDRLSPRQSHIPLHRGDVFLIGTSGGGGLGDPFARAPEAVARDVVEGRVSVAQARSVYGVVVDAEGAIDFPATETRRAAR